VLRNPLRRAVRFHEGLPILPGSFPIVGHLPEIFHNPSKAIARGTAEFGELFWIETGFGRPRDLVYSSPQAFELLRHKEVESAHFFEQLPVFFGRSLLVVDDEEHRHMRAATHRPFTPRGLDRVGVGRLAAAAAQAQVEGWSRRTSVAILPATQRLALEVIFGIIGVHSEQLELWRKQFRRFMLSAINLPWRFPGSPMWLAHRARAWIDTRLREMIAATRASPDAPGLLAELICGRDEAGQRLTEQELLDNLRLLVLAGHETTASSMAWTLIYAAHSRERWDRLVEEACALAGPPTTAEELGVCRYAQALFREAVRMHPPVYAETRRLRAAIELEGRPIPAGTIIYIPLTNISRAPSLYERPDEFDPQRWLDVRRLSPIDTAQFGGGPHFCLGYHLALLEGTQLAITAARQLSAAGLRPEIDEIPKPVYMPLTHPPARTRIRLVPA
jgi:cytochrome P450